MCVKLDAVWCHQKIVVNPTYSEKNVKLYLSTARQRIGAHRSIGNRVWLRIQILQKGEKIKRVIVGTVQSVQKGFGERSRRLQN